MTTSLSVSAIVSNFNGAKYLPRLLETLSNQQGVQTEIIVVDRKSTDQSLAMLAQHPVVRVVSERPESGLVTGYAVGAEHAKHELLFFCNEDMWFDPHCLRLLAERINLPACIAAADPWQWTYDGQILIHAGTRFCQAGFEVNCPYPFRRCDFTVPLAAGDVIPFGCAGAILVHRAVYDKLGGWDRGFFLDHEDVDFFLRWWQAGWRCVTVPQAKVFHAVNVSNTKHISGGVVSRRRFISGRSSLMVMGVKYFSPAYALLPVATWAALTFKHLVTVRWSKAWLSMLAGKEFVSRLGPALRYRRRSGFAGRRRRGELFFKAPEFQSA
jgi:GT2 family glycosyltransferase